MENIKAKISKDTKIGVLCGGMSSEKDVSMRSGKNCFEALKRLGYKNAELVVVDENIAQTLKDKKIEIAYIALHGKYGEDGCIQGLLEILKIPYTGCGVMASSICMNKEYTKRILATCPEIPLIKSTFVKKGENIQTKVANLRYPLITKPVCEGSSFGMTKVNKPEELEKAYAEADGAQGKHHIRHPPVQECQIQQPTGRRRRYEQRYKRKLRFFVHNTFLPRKKAFSRLICAFAPHSFCACGKACPQRL